VQECFLRVFHGIRRFDEKRLFEPYLIRSVVYTALNVVQKTSNWLPIATLENVGNLENMLSRASLIEDQVEYSQLKQKILHALSGLPPRQRAAIVLRYYLEMSEKEMAEAMDAASGTVKWLLNAARGRLRTLLGGERSAE
jgi:RNA polymerase sigma-70 factor (ECF subfamily)